MKYIIVGLGNFGGCEILDLVERKDEGSHRLPLSLPAGRTLARCAPETVTSS